jgi:hypothetical protein
MIHEESRKMLVSVLSPWRATKYNTTEAYQLLKLGASSIVQYIKPSINIKVYQLGYRQKAVSG